MKPFSSVSILDFEQGNASYKDFIVTFAESLHVTDNHILGIIYFIYFAKCFFFLSQQELAVVEGSTVRFSQNSSFWCNRFYAHPTTISLNIYCSSKITENELILRSDNIENTKTFVEL